MKELLTTAFLFSAICTVSFSQIGKVGINTTTPAAMLHVMDSSVLFSTTLNTLPGMPGNPPVSGAGIRTFWYPDKAAFRTGRVTGAQWDKINTGNYSFAAGHNNTASGAQSFSIGNGNLATGENTIAAGIGANNKAKANLGSWIVLSEYDDNYNLKCVKTAKVDGKKILPDAWYMLKDGKFVKE